MDNSLRNKILASNIKAERYRKGLTQAQLSELINVSISTVSLIERGIQTPSVYIIHDMSKALKIEISDLLKGI